MADEPIVAATDAEPATIPPVDRLRWPRFVPADKPTTTWDRAELLLFGAILLIAVLTPAFDAQGEPNAPLKSTLQSSTGGGVCLLQRKAGIECGGCGMTRGFVQLGHGNVWKAMLLNPLSPIVFLWVLVRFTNYLALNLARRRLDLGLTLAWSWRLYLGFFIAFGLLFAWRVLAVCLDLAPLFPGS